MKPILFSPTATTFNTNGIGRLDAISCVATEERNGMYELEMEIAETALHADAIGMDSIIVVKPNQKDNPQAFRVYKMKKPMKGIYSITARHISYQLSFITTMPFTIPASASACSNTLAGLKSNSVDTCPFDFSTDVVTVANYKQDAPATIRSRLGGVEGSVLDQFGGEYKWDNYTVYLLKNRGVVTPQVSLRYGKNIIDLNQEENIENTVTGIVPFWRDSDGANIVTLTEKVIEIPNASSYPYRKTIPYDFSSSFETQPTEAQLRARAQAYVGTSGLGTPNVSIKLSFVNLSDTEGYKDIAAFQAVGLCDNVVVQFEKLGISTTAEIVKYEYDVLTEKYNSVEIGSLRSSLMTTISGNIKDIEGVPELILENGIDIISEAKDYADDVAGDAEAAAKEYAEGKAGDAEAAAKDYADDVAGDAEAAAKEYAEGKANDAERNAKGYTDTKLTSYPTNTDLTQAIDTATGWLTSADGKIMARKDANGDWKELFFLSATATQNSGNVLRINENGIGFGRNGWGGAFTQAWTLDGKLIIGGTNVPELTVYTSDNTQTRQILFKVSRDGITWNLANSSMSQNGTLTIKNAFIDGGTLAVVDPNWTPPTQGATPTDNDYLFKVNALGVIWNLTNSKMSANGTLTIKNAFIDGGTLAVVDPNWTPPTQGATPTDDDYIFRVNSLGLLWNLTNSKMTTNGDLTINDATITGGSFAILDPNNIHMPPYTDSDYLFKVDGDGIVWNLINSQMTANGDLTINGATITGGSFAILNASASEPYVDSDYIFKADSNGLVWNLANTSLSRTGVLTAGDDSASSIEIGDGNIDIKYGGTTLASLHSEYDMLSDYSYTEMAVGFLEISSSETINIIADNEIYLSVGGNGITILDNSVTLYKDITLGGANNHHNMNVVGALNVTDDLTATSDVEISGALKVHGNIQTQGTLGLETGISRNLYLKNSAGNTVTLTFVNGILTDYTG